MDRILNYTECNKNAPAAIYTGNVFKTGELLANKLFKTWISFKENWSLLKSQQKEQQKRN